MTKRKDVAASVKQRLLNLARDRGEEFNLLLTRHGSERLLYRLSLSEHAPDFVLKGALLFCLWSESLHRPTRDLDLLGSGKPDLGRLEDVFRSVCATDVDDDGLTFLPETVRAERIRDDAEYEGVRVLLEARLGSARVRLQVDVGFGDAVVPPPVQIDFPTLLGQPMPSLCAYRRETVVAEKLQAMVMLGLANSRMKDFFDLRFLASTFEFDGIELTRAIEATFQRRQTPIPAGAPTALTDDFAGDASKQTQWTAFLKRSRLEHDDPELSGVIALLRTFLLPPLDALAHRASFDCAWANGGPWQPERNT